MDGWDIEKRSGGEVVDAGGMGYDGVAEGGKVDAWRGGMDSAMVTVARRIQITGQATDGELDSVYKIIFDSPKCPPC
jgi:hypothetical protein